MTMEEFLKRVRLRLRDSVKGIWSDAEQERQTGLALRRYFMDYKELINEFEIHPNENGVYEFPEGYQSFVCGFSSDGYEISLQTSFDLQQMGYSLAESGDLIYIVYDDLSSIGEYSVYPVVNQNVIASYADGYGTTDTGPGVEDAGGGGVFLNGLTFDPAGVIRYIRTGELSDVHDIAALEYLTVSYAYGGDGDFSNADLSETYRKLYQLRLSRYSQIRSKTSGRKSNGMFF